MNFIYKIKLNRFEVKIAKPAKVNNESNNLLLLNV